MDLQEFILVEKYCQHHVIEISFIESLRDFGLIEIVELNETRYFPTNQLPDIEKYTRFYRDLNINLEGINAISRLLMQVNDLNSEILALKNRINFLEP